MADNDELQELKNRLKLLQMNKQLNKQKQEEESKAAAEEVTNDAAPSAEAGNTAAPEEDANAPNYSIFVGNLGPRVSKEQLEEHFACCGSIKRSTIICDHYTHIPKGYGYIEFAEQSGFDNALKLAGTLLGGQTIEVKEKVNKIKKKGFFRRSPRRRFRRS